MLSVRRIAPGNRFVSCIRRIVVSQEKSAVVILSKIAAAFLFVRLKGRGFQNLQILQDKQNLKGLDEMKQLKKILSIIIVVALTLTMLPTAVMAKRAKKVTVYVTVSMHGNIVETEDGEDILFAPVQMKKRDSYNLDDVFSALHTQYGYEDGYESAEGDFGPYITKFWGDTSGNFGYQVNGGDAQVMGLGHEVENEDYVDVSIFKSYYPDTESYTKFANYRETAEAGEDITLNLLEAGYDENWNTVFAPLADTQIVIDGEKTELFTDAEGGVTLNFETYGRHIVSAVKTKEVNGETVTAITPPVCEVTVNPPAYLRIADSIASRYIKKGVSKDTNMVWLIADLAVYSYLNGEDSFISGAEEQKCVDAIIKESNKTTSPSVLAKNIIALRAMGYDARNTYLADSSEFDMVEKLIGYVDEADPAATNVYTLPYVIIALSQAEDYATDEQIDMLLEHAISNRDTWINNEWGTDAASAMILALAPYCEENSDVREAVEGGVELLTSSINENEAIDNAAATGLAICALSALGKDAKALGENGEINLLDGLMSFASDEADGFLPMENSFSTEQGLRGILAYQLFGKGENLGMYDFSEYPMEAAYCSKKSTSSGGGGSSPSGSDNEEETTESTDITAENPQPEIVEEVVTEKTASINPDVKIMPVSAPDKTFADIEKHESKAQIEALAERGIINGKSETDFDPEGTMTRAEFATIIARGLGLPDKGAATFTDISKDDWFCNYIGTAFSYGIIKGVSDTHFNPNGTITRQEAAVMIARAAKLCGMDTETNEDFVRDTVSVFADYISIGDWAKSAMAFCIDKGILTETTAEISPSKTVSRAEIAVMLYNMLDKSSMLTGEEK